MNGTQRPLALVAAAATVILCLAAIATSWIVRHERAPVVGAKVARAAAAPRRPAVKTQRDVDYAASYAWADSLPDWEASEAAPPDPDAPYVRVVAAARYERITPERVLLYRGQ